MRLPSSYLSYTFLLIIFVFILTSLLKNSYMFSEWTSFLISSTSSPSVYDDSNVVSIKNIMRASFTLSQENPNLIKMIRRDFLVPPSNLPYNLKENTDNPSMGQSQKIQEMIGQKRNGFFVECGAQDGEEYSNSLVFENVYGWQGILIEGNPKNFELLLQKHRKAWAVSACLSITPYPTMVNFYENFNLGKISDIPLGGRKNVSNLVEILCLPFYSIMLALNATSIDYFSLDIEGHELPVLKTIPWEKVNITTLSVEYKHGEEGKAGLQKYMEKQGYKVYTDFITSNLYAMDLIFYHPLLLKKKTMQG